MANQDYYTRFIYETLGADKVTDVTSRVRDAARAASEAKREQELWQRSVEGWAKTYGVSIGDVNRMIRQHQQELHNARGEAELYEKVIGRVGGRVLGAEVLGKLGVPGGGFIGSQVAGSLGLSGGAAVGLGVGAGVAFAGYEFAKQADGLLKYAQAQRNLAQEIGVTSGEMATLSAISSATGTKLDSVAKSVSKLSEEMAKGGTHSREIASALSELGLDKSVAFEEPAKALNEIAAALSKIGDQGQRVRLATEILGEQGRVLAAMADKLPELSKALQVDDRTIDNLARVKDNLGRILEHLKNIALVRLNDLLPQGDDPEAVRRHGGAARSVAGGRAQIDARGLTTGIFNPGAQALTPEEKSRRDDVVKQVRTRYGSPEDRFKGGMEGVTQDITNVDNNYRSGLITDDVYNRQYQSAMNRKMGLEEQRRREEQIRREIEELGKLMREPVSTADAALHLAAELPRRFPDIRGTQQYKSFMGYLVPRGIQGAITDSRRMVRTDADKLGREFATETKRGTEDYWRLGQEETRDKEQAEREQDRSAREAYTNQSKDIENQSGLDIARSAIPAAARAGFSRYGMTQRQIQNQEFGLEESKSRDLNTQEILALRSRSYSATLSAGEAGTPQEKMKLQQEAIDLELQARKKEAEEITQSIERLNKFNEAIDKAAEEVNKNLTGGIVSVLMGAQHGAMRGQGGKGALDALRGYFEGFEDQVLKNVVSHGLDSSGVTGAKGGLAKVGFKLPDWLSKGTIFQNVGEKKDVALQENTAALRALTGAVSSRVSGGGGSVIIGPGGVPVPVDASMGGPKYSPYGSSAGYDRIMTGAGIGDPSSIAALASGPGSQAAILALSLASGGGVGTELASSNKFFRGLGSIIGGTQFATTTNPWDLLHGRGQSGGDKVSISTGEAVGAIATQVGAAIGAYEGVRTISHGGAKNVSGGIAETLGSAAAFTGPAAPYVAAAAAVAGIVSSFLPDARTAREQKISKTLFTDQYLAPPSQNITEGSNAGYADVNFRGGVRTSNLSPYPVVSNPYLDVPRRTDVPGHLISQFGGFSNTPGAIVTPQAPMTVNISAIDPASFHDVLVRSSSSVADALHHSLSSNFHPLVSTLRQQLGHA